MARDLPPALVVVPALDEEGSIGAIVEGMRQELVREIVVVDNGSTDRTAEVASLAGARVVREPTRGYGRACLLGLAHCRALDPPPRMVVFIDGDGSDCPADLPSLLAPILAGTHDLVVGSRIRRADPGSLLPAQIVGNAIATLLIRLLTGVRYTDLGPFRAITWAALERLEMRDPDFGWTVEMQLKAARAGLRVAEADVAYRRRAAGRSKVAGTLEGSVRAGWKILWTIARYSSWRGGC